MSNFVFKKYTEIENSYNSKFVNELREQGFADPSIEYVAETKVDGSNLQVSIDENGEFNFGSRSQLYPAHSDFQGSKVCFLKERIKDKLIKMKELIAKDQKVIDTLNKLEVMTSENEDIQKKFVLTVYGELCGGMYRHPDVEKVKGAIKIQGRVDYHPDNKFVPFDIVLRKPDGSGIMMLDQDEVVKYCNEVELPYPVILFRGTFDECLNFPVEFIDQTGNILWGLPIIENNFSEGIVIKPNKAMWKGNGERVILKKKSERFKERISKNKEPKEVLPMNDVEKKWFDTISEFVTESRLMSVLSKIDCTKLNDKCFGMILGAFLKDLWNDFNKEYECDIEKELSENPDFNFDKVWKEASKYISKFIQPFFLNLLNK